MRIKQYNRPLILTAFLFALLFLVVPQSDAAVQFNDIQGHWAEAAIQKMADQGVVKGYPDSTFQPDSSISRAEFAVLTVKAFELENKSGKVFSDTNQHWARDYVATANAHGIISGFEDETFRPDQFITREEMALMIVKAARLEMNAGPLGCNDSDKVSAWAKEAVATAYAEKIIVGMPDGSFQPQAHTTRAQAVIVLNKAMELAAEGIKTPEPETPAAPQETSSSSGSSRGDGGSGGAPGSVTIRSIEIKTPPDKVVYSEGETLDLTGLTVALKKSNDTVEEVAFSGFAAKKITTAPANGSVLKSTDHEVVISAGGRNISQPITVKAAATVTITNVSAEDRASHVYWYRFTVNGAYSELQIKTEDGTALGPVIDKADFEAAGFYQGMASPDGIIVIFVDGIERYRGTPVDYSSTIVTVTNVSAEDRAAHVYWYRFTVNGTYSELQIKTEDGTALGPVIDKADFEAAGFYQGMASPEGIIVIYVDGIERYRGIPALYSPDEVSITGITIKTEPDKVDYSEGESLDLTGLVVTLSKSDGTDEEAAFADFASRGITASPANGAVLTAADSTVIITVNGKTASLAISVGSEVPAEVTVTDVSVDKYWNGLLMNGNVYRFTVNGPYSMVQIKTDDGTALGLKISKAFFEHTGYYLGGYLEGFASLDSVIVICVDGVERYRDVPAVYVKN